MSKDSLEYARDQVQALDFFITTFFPLLIEGHPNRQAIEAKLQEWKTTPARPGRSAEQEKEIAKHVLRNL